MQQVGAQLPGTGSDRLRSAAGEAARLINRTPLWVALVVPFLLLVSTAVVSVAILSDRSGRGAVEALTFRLGAEISERVQDEVSEFLAEPGRVLAMATDGLDLDGERAGPLGWCRQLAAHLVEFEAISNVGFGSAEGDYCGAERRSSGQVLLQRADASTGFDLVLTEQDGTVVSRKPKYDPRLRPWYVGAARSGAPVWSPIYKHYADPTLLVALGMPMRDATGRLRGVATAVVRLARLDEFLRGLRVGRTGLVLVLDGDGVVIGSPMAPHLEDPPAQARTLLRAEESGSPLVRALGAQVALQRTAAQPSPATSRLDLGAGGGAHLVTVAPLLPQPGLRWWAVVAIPESDFMEPIRSAALLNSGLAVLATLLSLGMGIWSARRVARPVSQIHAAAEALARGEAPGDLPVHRGDEVGGLARSFQGMALQLAERQRALAESERSYREIFEGTREAVFVHDAGTGALLDLNLRAEQLFGIPRGELLAAGDGSVQTLPAPWAEDDPARWIRRAVERGPLLFESRAVCRTGGPLWVEVAVSAASIGGKARAIATVRDVTARKQAEEGLRRLAAAVEQTPVGIVIAGARGELLYANAAFEQASGLRREEILGLAPADLEAGGRASEFFRQLRATIASEETWQGRLVSQPGAGEPRTEDAAIAPVKEEGGATRSWVAVLRDVSQELSLQQQLAASQRLESIGRLAGGIAHDFNNLLTVILSGAEALEEDLRHSHPASADDAREVREAGERARDLTRQLLALARRQVIAPVPVDVGATLRSCERLLRRVLGGDVAWTVSVQPDLWLLRCDPSQLEQVLLNLAVNARDAMPQGGTLAFEATNLAAGTGGTGGHPGLAEGDYVRVVVRDTGVGMSASVLERLFEPFFTTKAPGKGTGLGLSTVYGIVKQNGGSIRCESAPGAGTSFELLFPRTQEPLRPAEARPQSRARQGSETVLLVEDEPAVRDLAARALRGAGYRVLVAPDAAEALQLSARETAPLHLLLSDMVLPGLGGRQLAAELRRLRPGLRVLLMSGHVAAADDRAGLAEDGTSFLPKPFSIGALLDKVRQTIEGTSGPLYPGGTSGS